MYTTRRGFLVSSLATVALVGCGVSADSDSDLPTPEPAPDRPAEPAAWVPSESLDQASFPWGVQVGEATANGAIVSCRTDAPAATLVVMRAEGDGWVEASRQPVTAADGFVRAVLTDLAADNAYTAMLVTEAGGRSATARFRTALAAGGFRKLVLTATSCFGGSNPLGFENVAQAARGRPDAMLLLGDSVYADGSVSYADYLGFWERWLAKSPIQELFTNTSVITCWDDHEVDNNWTYGEADRFTSHVEPEQVEAAVTAFRRAMPMGVGADGVAMWRKVSFGDVLDVLVLDARGERDDADRIVSDAQLAWAIDALQTSTAAFKLVMASVHMTDHSSIVGTVQAEDRWQGYPLQRTPLVAALAATPGAFVVTGDMHYGAVQRVDPEGVAGWDVWEVAAGPVGSTLFPIEDLMVAHSGNPPQYDTVLQGWSTCRLTLDPGLMTVLVEFIDDAGAVVRSRLLELARSR
jgi:phosphodiesterase/alkaline phosphatase D-like protein